MFIQPYLLDAYLYCKNKCYIQKNKLATSEHENIYIGNLYDSELKKVKFDGFELDEINKQKKIIYEYKKSCSNLEGNKLQLLYYLYLTRDIFIDFKGVLKCIEDKLEIDVLYDNYEVEKLLIVINEIKELNKFDVTLTNNLKCEKCGLYDYCHS